jgi:hypothetical protein
MKQMQKRNLSPEQIQIGEWLPEWAKSVANGDYTLPNAALQTRDGRRSGNAVLVGLSELQWDSVKLTYLVVTDAGNIMHLNLNELKELFYPPEWVMEKLLPAHIAGIEEYENAKA